MESLEFKSIYWNYYQQLEKEFFDMAPYCTIDELNDNAYSIKYLQLYLSICGEVDTVCKTLCKELDSSMDIKKCNIKDYMKILTREYPTFANEEVQILGYKYRTIQPWRSISNNDSPNWWKFYNKVKHHRDAEGNYKQAKQKNVLEALCALYVLIEYWVAKKIVTDGAEECNYTMPHYKSKVLNLTNWMFYLSFMGQPERFSTKSFFNYIKSVKETNYELVKEKDELLKDF